MGDRAKSDSGTGLPSQPAESRDVDRFLEKLATVPVVRRPDQLGRLMFAMDATASRQATWDQASHIQSQMFAEASKLGGLEIQLAWYRGFGEFCVSPWLREATRLLKIMSSVSCQAGETQIRKLLKHAVKETRQRKISAVVFIGDAFEEEIDRVSAVAGELGLLGVPVFMFHEGDAPHSSIAFQQIARLSKGAFCRFDASSADALSRLLRAVAIFAAGGVAALEDLGRRHGGEVLHIAHQLREK